MSGCLCFRRLFFHARCCRCRRSPRSRSLILGRWSCSEFGGLKVGFDRREDAAVGQCARKPFERAGNFVRKAPCVSWLKGVGVFAGGRSREEGEGFVVATALQVVFELWVHGRGQLCGERQDAFRGLHERLQVACCVAFIPVAVGYDREPFPESACKKRIRWLRRLGIVPGGGVCGRRAFGGGRSQGNQSL